MTNAPEVSKVGFLDRVILRFYRDSRLVVLAIALIVVAGLSSAVVLPRMEDPVLSRRVGIINTRLAGADAARVESLVTSRVEEALRDIEEIKELRSTSRLGISTVVVELRDDVLDTDPVWSRVRSRIEDVLPQLPEEANRPQFDELEVRAFALILGVTWQHATPTDWRVLRRLAIELQDQLQNIPGTDTVDRFADPGEEIGVTMDPTRLASLGLNPSDVSQRLASHDSKRSAGLLRSATTNFPMEVGNQFDEVSQIGEIPIRDDGESFVRLKDVAEVRIGTPEPRSRSAKLSGDDAIVLGCMVQPNHRIDHWTGAAQAKIDAFAAQLPAGVGIRTILKQSEYVDARLSSLLSNLLMGAMAISLVIFALMGWRSALVVTSTLPLASFIVLFALRVGGIPIHQMSITGLIIALGLLIDNAIVVVDEVHRKLTSGRTPAQAMVEAVRHLAIPLAGSTLTTALAFAPIALMPGPAGEFVGAIAISVILAVTASLVLSLTITASLATRLLASTVRNERVDSRDDRPKTQWYRLLLMKLIGRPSVGIGLSLAAPLAGFLAFTQLDEQFFPPSGRNQFFISLELPPAGSLSETIRTSEHVNAIAREMGIANVDWFYGESAPQFYYNVMANRRGVSNFAQGIVTIDPEASTTDTIRELQRRLDANVTGARTLVRQLEQGPPFEAPIEVRLFGPDLDVLQELGYEIGEILASVPDVTQIKSELSEPLPQLALRVDAESARMASLNPSTIADDMFAMLEGRTGGMVLQDTEQLPVVVRVMSSARSDLQRITSMDLRVDDGREMRRVPIASLATLSLESKTAIIPRLNRERMNEVAAYLTAGVLPSEIQQDFQSRLAASDFELPVGYRLEYGGEGSKRDDAVGNLVSTVGVLAVCMIATLVLSFGSFRLAGMIGLVAVLSIGLGILSLSIAGYPFGFMSIIGTMGLIGVAINDSIVVLAAIQANPRAAAGNLACIVDEVVESSRHVIATTLTTVAGFAPLVLDGGSFWPPMAVCIGGGVLGATFLALVMIPALFYWNASMTITNRWSRQKQTGPESDLPGVDRPSLQFP